MTYAIQQFHATRYVTIETALDMLDAKAAQSEIKRKCPELPTRIVQFDTPPHTKQEETATDNPVG